MMKNFLLVLVAVFAIGMNIKAQTPELWGMAGTTIFKTDTGGNNFSVEYTFPTGDESYSSLFLASNNKFYGLARGNGNPSFGSLFEYDPLTVTYTKKVAFSYVFGAFPEGNLIEANGKLYGMTSDGGGGSSRGTLFEYDYVLDTIITKHTFGDGTVFRDGLEPKGSLILATNGKLYGMTSKGGKGPGEGTIFEYDPVSEVYTQKIASLALDGVGIAHSNPYGSLLQVANGKFYGLTSDMGTSYGLIFEFDLINDTIFEKIELATNYGSNPQGSLIEATNGKLYGMTNFDNVSYTGVIFEYDPVGNSYAVEYGFASGFAEGGRPKGDVFQSSNGKLYGMTELGGANSKGVLFEYDIVSGTYTVKHDFTGPTGSGNFPKGNLIETSFCYPSFYTAGSIDVCSGSSYTYADGTISTNITVNEGHTSTLSGQAVSGCDSIVTENLLVLTPALVTDTRTECSPYVWIDGNTYIANNTTTTHTIIGGAFNGCDSIVMLDLTITTIDTSVIQAGTDLTANELVATYRWLDCNNNYAVIPSATFRTYYGITNGDYAVEVTSYSCVDTSSCYTITGVGIDENATANNITIYPNPVKDQLTINASNEKIESIKMMDVTGKMILITNGITQNTTTINVADLPKGLYFLQIQTEKGIETKRFIKE